MFNNLKTELESIKKRDPAAKNNFQIFMLYSGFHAVLNYRFSNWLYRKKLKFLARLISQISRFFTGVEIHPSAKIGKRLFIDHGMGVVIGETTIIGDDCTLYQGVTLGGTGKDSGKRHPTLGNNVLVGCGAKILGPFYVGDNVKIAANAVVLQSIPNNATAVGVPAKIVKINGKKVDFDLDQINIPDPIQQEISYLKMEILALRNKIKTLRGDIQDDNI